MSCQGTTKTGAPCRCTITNNGFCRSHAQQGEGIIDDARNYIRKGVKAVKEAVNRRVRAFKEGPAAKPSSRLTEFLNSHPNKITKLELMRKPIIKEVHGALDAMSLGGFSGKQRELDYDKVYHNALMVWLDNGHVYTLEKNHVVEVKKTPTVDYANERWDIPLHGRQLSMKQLIDNAARGVGDNDAFWKYRAGTNNCQRFTRDVVEENGLMPGVGDNVKHFEQQDASELLTSLPGGDTIPNHVTDLAGTLDRVIHGDGVQLNKRGIPCPL